MKRAFFYLAIILTLIYKQSLGSKDEIIDAIHKKLQSLLPPNQNIKIEKKDISDFLNQKYINKRKQEHSETIISLETINSFEDLGICIFERSQKYKNLFKKISKVNDENLKALSYIRTFYDWFQKDKVINIVSRDIYYSKIFSTPL